MEAYFFRCRQRRESKEVILDVFTVVTSRMAERNIGRPWTAQEDHLLTNAVRQHGPGDNWKIIALSVPGRSNKACRKRWLHSLSPSIRKTAWTSDEDKRLLALYATHGAKWSIIARQIPGRTDDACSKRYREALDPSLKKDEWTPEEDERLVQAYGRIGGKWGQVGHELKRSGLGCRNRWRMLERRRAARTVPSKSPSVFNTTLIEASPALEQHQMDTWAAPSSSTRSFLMEQPPPSVHPPAWPTDIFHGNQTVLLQAHPSRPSLSHSYSTNTVQECSPHPHEVPLGESPLVPPFRFSSSSLSAALSDTQTTKSSPSINFDVPLDAPTIDHYQSSLSSTPATIAVTVPLLKDIAADGCPPHDPMSTPLSDAREVSVNDHSTCSTPQSVHAYHYDTNCIHYGTLITPIPSPTTNSRDIPPTCPASSGITVLNLSPISSPHNASLPVNLPYVEQGPIESVLFTPSNDGLSVPRKTSTSPKRSEQQAPARLSSILVVTSDPTVLPYACGYEQCYKSSVNLSCFKTSKELSDHCKAVHPDRSGTDRPYRCGLDSCGKSWKSVNGLQYHLQISQSHFQQAISTSFRQKKTETRSEDSSDAVDERKTSKKIHSCTFSQCQKVYRQLSGLRYHLLHGHPKDMPTQLHVVPPTLARRITEKLRTKGIQCEEA